jgi:hypothetical protein
MYGIQRYLKYEFFHHSQFYPKAIFQDMSALQMPLLLKAERAIENRKAREIFFLQQSLGRAAAGKRKVL